jgi:aminopeptidase
VLDCDAFAALLCEWCLQVEEGQQVLVSSTTLAEPIVRALHRALLERGAWPFVHLSPPQLQADFYEYAHEDQLDRFPLLDLIEAEALDARIAIDAPGDTRALAGVDPVRISRALAARRPVQEARMASRWCGTIWPTAALAHDAAMSERDYTAFIERALFLDRPDPAAAWASLSKRQGRLVERLSAARDIRIEAEGTDLRLRVDGRRWVNSNGRRNMPSGEVFTGPLEDSASGTIRFTIPSRSRGVYVEGAELTFDAGEVVAARAERGEEYLQGALGTDAGARRLGEIGIGTNTGIDRATGSTLLDEKIAGTIHLALGRSYPETDGANSSALHWDLICDLRGGGQLSVDGELLDLDEFVADSGDRAAVQ